MNHSNFVPPAYLVMTNVDPADWCAPFTPNRRLIGRDFEADIRIPQRFTLVSRRHAEIWADHNALKLRDIGSRSGTHVNGVWLARNNESTLVIGDRIWMGGVEFEVAGQVPLIAQVLAENSIPGGGPEIAGIEETALTREDLSPVDPLARSTEFGTRSAPPPIRTLLAELSHAELEVVLWLGRGYLDDNELGEQLFRSPNTIRTHLSNIFRKLNVHSRAEVLSCLKRIR